MSDAPVSEDRVGQLTEGQFSNRLGGSGIGVGIGPFNAHVIATVPGLDRVLYQLYSDYSLVGDEQVYSFHVRLDRLRRIARRPVVRFIVDGRTPHEDMPLEQALPVLEWGLNLVVALRSHAFLMIHAAVLDRGGNAIVLPAAPGMGKSTLCAALAHRNWRLLSDEFGLLRPGLNEMIPVPRPIALKNDSINVIKEFAPEAEFGPTIPKTRKGTLAHVKPPAFAIEHSGDLSVPRWVVFPEWVPGSETTIARMPDADAFMMIASNAFNYELLGEAAFTAVADILGSSKCYRLQYSELESAVKCLDEIAV